MELVDVADSKSAGGDTMWVRVPPPAPNKAGSLFELFYRKTIPLHVAAIGMTGFSKSLDKSVLLKTGKVVTKNLFRFAF